MSILKELWPFVIEFFYKNEDIRKAARDPKSIVKGLIHLTIMFVIVATIYVGFNTVLDNVVYRNKNLTDEMLNLDKNYWELSNRYKVIYEQNNALLSKQMRVEVKIKKLEDALDKQKITNNYLTDLVNKCTIQLDPDKKDKLDYNIKDSHIYIRRPIVEEEDTKTINDLLGELE